MMDPSKILGFLGLEVAAAAPVASGPAPAPTPAGVLYTHPNPDTSQKRCENCMLWARTDQCLIHAPHVQVTAGLVCGYHVFGSPHEEFEEHGADPVDPELSGLCDPGPEGASCGRCRWFTQGAAGGLCRAVSDPYTGKPPVPVEAGGCCARFELAVPLQSG